jgi:membrane-associated phospholipid phosphatase
MPRDVRNPIFASLVCALLLPLLAVLAYKVGPAIHVDVSVLSHLAQPEGSNGYWLANAVRSLANPLPFVAILAGVVALGLAARRTRETVAAVAIAAGANVSTQVFKHLLEHPRFQEELGAHQPSMEAFPSGHTTAAASLAVALVLVVPPRLRPVAAAAGAGFTAAVSLGVVVIKAHYPSDVLGGLLVVGAWTFAAIAALRLLRRRGPDSPPREQRETASDRFAVSLR